MELSAGGAAVSHRERGLAAPQLLYEVGQTERRVGERISGVFVRL